MRSALIILAAAAIAFGISWWRWSDLLSPPLPGIGREPTLRQRQFGIWIPPLLAAEMERRLPPDFAPAGNLQQTLPAMGHAAKITIYFDWDAIESAGGKRDAPVNVRVVGMKFGDALMAILAEQKPPLACIADDDLLALTITTPYKHAMNRTRKRYTIGDLAPTPAEERALIARIQADVAPQWWQASATHPGWEIAMIAGQLAVRTNAATTYDVAKYLNDLRVRRARLVFAARAGSTIAITVTLVACVLIAREFLARRKRRRAGLCRLCGYDLRASAERCPECGTVFAASSATTLTR